MEGITNIVSSSSSSPTQSSPNIGINESGYDAPTENATGIKFNEEEVPTSKSCDNLLQTSTEEDSALLRSLSCQSLNSSQSRKQGKYNHVQSKIKQYIKVLNEQSPRSMIKIPPAVSSTSTKEEYLEEINYCLTRELEEKNSLLLKLQENYEHLLLKYAEAQNKIDCLRLKTCDEREHHFNEGQGKVASLKTVYLMKDGSHKGQVSENLVQNYSIRGPEVKIGRPSTLVVAHHGRSENEKDLKAVTPTDSEGVSSVITSMSGHSKILTNLDDGHNEVEKEEKATLKSEVLEQSTSINDPIDKVKNWQNSLPPLEFIETPETALYDLTAEPLTTPSTRYKDITELDQIPEGGEDLPISNAKSVSQAVMKKYLRTLSLPSSLTRRNMLAQIYKRRSNHTIDLTSPLQIDCSPDEAIPETTKPSDVPSSNIIGRRKRPPFLRSASLPAYDNDSANSGRMRSCVPPLNFDSLSFSDEETSTTVSKSNAITTPSFLTSHDLSFQTLNSPDSCKATTSHYSITSASRSVKPVTHKSTCITPSRSHNMMFTDSSESNGTNCNICGESVLSVKAMSYQGIHLQCPEGMDCVKSNSLNRSYSFNSESNSSAHCVHPQIVNREHHQISEAFEDYTKDLKARSQVILKALTAHVRNTS